MTDYARIAADIDRGTDVLSALTREMQQEGATPFSQLAATLDMHPEALQAILSITEAQILLSGASPAPLALRLGMSIGARLARANADRERVGI